MRPKALKLQPGFAPQGLHSDKNFNFTFDPTSRQPIAAHRRALVGQGFSSVIRGHCSKDSTVGAIHQRETFLTQQGQSERGNNSKESCPSCVTSPGQSRGFAAERGRDAPGFSGRDAGSAGEAAATTAPYTLQRPQQEASGSPSSHEGDIPRGDSVSPSAAQRVASAEREYHGVPAVPHPTYPAPPPLHHQSLPTVCLPLPPVSISFTALDFYKKCYYISIMECVSFNQIESNMDIWLERITIIGFYCNVVIYYKRNHMYPNTDTFYVCLFTDGPKRSWSAGLRYP